MKPSRPPSLRARALQALALREHSRSELRNKLCRPRPGATGFGQAPDDDRDAANDRRQALAAEVETLLDELQAQGLLSDERFVESRVHARASRFGNRRIQQELQRHGVTLDEQTATELRLSEEQRARSVWSRRFGAPAADAAERARQMRFLAARGFSPEVIRRVVKGHDPDEPEPAPDRD